MEQYFFVVATYNPAFDSIIQSDLCGSQPKYEFKYELPNKPFKHLLKFMGTQVTNFEMLIREDTPEEVDEPESFNVKSFLYVYSDHSILECYNLFSGVELSMRSFFVILM